MRRRQRLPRETLTIQRSPSSHQIAAILDGGEHRHEGARVVSHDVLFGVATPVAATLTAHGRVAYWQEREVVEEVTDPKREIAGADVASIASAPRDGKGWRDIRWLDTHAAPPGGRTYKYGVTATDGLRHLDARPVNDGSGFGDAAQKGAFGLPISNALAQLDRHEFTH